MTKPTSRKLSPKATKCWANVMPEGTFAFYSQSKALCELEALGDPECCETVLAWLLTQDQIPAVIEAMARGIKKQREGAAYGAIKTSYYDEARAALRAAGVGVK